MAFAVIAILSILNIFLALVGNTACFLIFRFNKQFKEQSYGVYLSFCAITDTISLFVWNLNNFSYYFFKIRMESETLFRCRFFTFIQFTSLQSSAWLLTLMTIDRFFVNISMPGSFSSRLPFGTRKCAFAWSLIVVVAFILVNVDLLVLNGYYDPPSLRNYTKTYIGLNHTRINVTQQKYYQSLNTHCYESWGAVISWDNINNYVYSFGPFVVMLVFNSLLIHKTLLPSRKVALTANRTLSSLSSSSTKGHSEKRKTTFFLLAITFGFIIMTLPQAVLFGYLLNYFNNNPEGSIYLKLADYLSFLNRSSLFFNCFITNKKFRSTLCKVFHRKASKRLFKLNTTNATTA